MLAFPDEWNTLILAGALPEQTKKAWYKLKTEAQRQVVYIIVTFYYPQGGTGAAGLIQFLIFIETPGTMPYAPAASVNALFTQILGSVYAARTSESAAAFTYWDRLSLDQRVTFAYTALTTEAWKKTKNFFTLFHRVTMLEALQAAATGIPYGTLTPATGGNHTVHHKKPAVLTPSHVTYGQLASETAAKQAPATNTGLIVYGLVAVALVFVYFSVD